MNSFAAVLAVTSSDIKYKQAIRIQRNCRSMWHDLRMRNMKFSQTSFMTEVIAEPFRFNLKVNYGNTQQTNDGDHYDSCTFISFPARIIICSYVLSHLFLSFLLHLSLCRHFSFCLFDEIVPLNANSMLHNC